MTIEIHQPELEALIHQRMASGHFQSVEDALIQALRASSPPVPVPAPAHPGWTLAEVFAEARRILDGEELDLRRDPSPGRTVDFS